MVDIGQQMILHPFNVHLRNSFFIHAKKLKKLIKKKKYLYKKNIFDKLISWKETDPKQYWQLLNSLKHESGKPNSLIYQ